MYVCSSTCGNASHTDSYAMRVALYLQPAAPHIARRGQGAGARSARRGTTGSGVPAAHAAARPPCAAPHHVKKACTCPKRLRSSGSSLPLRTRTARPTSSANTPARAHGAGGGGERREGPRRLSVAACAVPCAVRARCVRTKGPGEDERHQQAAPRLARRRGERRAHKVEGGDLRAAEGGRRRARPRRARARSTRLSARPRGEAARGRALRRPPRGRAVRARGARARW